MLPCTFLQYIRFIVCHGIVVILMIGSYSCCHRRCCCRPRYCYCYCCPCCDCSWCYCNCFFHCCSCCFCCCFIVDFYVAAFVVDGDNVENEVKEESVYVVVVISFVVSAVDGVSIRVLVVVGGGDEQWWWWWWWRCRKWNWW